MSKPIIQVENLSKQYQIGAREASYGTLRESITGAMKAPFQRFRRNVNQEDNTIWALKDVNFEVQPGEVVGIIGRNGAGKSTLLKVLSRITEPTTGRIKLYGRVASLLEVGTGFHPELTGRENIFLNGAILGMARREIERQFDEIVAFAEVEKFIDTPVKRYSSGMYLRLAFAVAAHLDPEILVVDEVLAVGDAAFQKKCLGKMQDVASQGRTVLFVSHNLAAVVSLCSRAILLNRGILDTEGTAEQVVSTYNKLNLSSQPMGTDLAGMPRRGSGAARTISFRMLNPDGQVIDRIGVGKTVLFEITFQCQETLREPRFAIAFSTLQGNRLLRVHSLEMTPELPSCSEGGTVICQVDEMPLVPSTYLVTVGIGRGIETLDHVENCAQIEIEPHDFYGTGQLPTPESTSFLARGGWTHYYH